MVDQTLKATDQIGSAAEKAATAAKTVTDQALAAGRDLKEKAANLAGASTEAIKDQASEFVDAAKDVASQATDKFKETVDGQKTAGANYVGSLADTIRRAAREFDADLPIAGTYIRKAASQVEGAADTIRTGKFNDLVRGAQSFARRQPTAFLGMAVLAGFGVVRFLKSSANDAENSNPRPASGNDPAPKPVRWHDDSKGYRDEFTQ
jgi:nucleotide-binding universal stress UspA family protein